MYFLKISPLESKEPRVKLKVCVMAGQSHSNFGSARHAYGVVALGLLWFRFFRFFFLSMRHVGWSAVARASLALGLDGYRGQI